MTDPPIPKLFAMIRKKEKEDAYKGMPSAELDDGRSVAAEVQLLSKIEQPSAPEEPSQSEIQQPDTYADVEEEEIASVDQPIPPIQELDIIATRLDSIDTFGHEGTMTNDESPLVTLGKPLEDKGKVKTIFGVTQAKQDTLQSTIPSTNHAPFGDQQFAFNSSFGQHNVPPVQPQFESPYEGPVQTTFEQPVSTPKFDIPPSLTQPTFGQPSFEQPSRPSFGQPSFGQSSFGQSPFPSFGALNTSQPTQGNTFASYSTGTNAFASLAQQSPQKQPEEQEKKPSLPSSFTAFRD